MARKPGNPEGATSQPIPISIPRGGDWIDNYAGSAEAPKREAPPRQEQPKVEQPAPVAKTPPILEVVEQDAALAAEESSAPIEPTPAPKKAKPKSTPLRKRSSTPSAKKKAKKRPRRADIGFRPELEEAAAKLRKHVIFQSDEDYVTRTDVIAQATCAVARALDTIQCGQVPARGHFSSPTAATYDSALQEAFYKGVALHYMENNIQVLPDRLLQLCHDHYRLRNGLAED